MNWNRISRTIAPTDTLVSLEDAKAHLRIGDLEADDLLIEALISTALANIEGGSGIGIPLTNATYVMSIDWLGGGFTIPLCPVQSIESITYRDADGTVQTLDPTAYVYDLDASPVIVRPAYGTAFPTVRCEPGSVKVTFVAGYGAAADVPANLRHAVLLMVEKYYDPATDNDRAIEALLSNYRVKSFG